MSPTIDLVAAKRVRDSGRFAIKQIDGGHRSEAAFLDVLAYAKQLESSNARHVLNHIENICEKCGHTKTEDGCAFCIAERRKAQPKIVCLCGSTRFIETFAIKQWELEREGKIVLGCVLLPESYCKVADHFAEHTQCKEQCDELHRRKIELADEILVLNVGGYIGESTHGEIAYATELGKPVNYLEPLNNGYTTEITDAGIRRTDAGCPRTNLSQASV